MRLAHEVNEGSYMNDKIDTGGGTAVGGGVNTHGGNFIGRDQYNIYNHPSQHTNNLSEDEKELLLAANENKGRISLHDSQQTNGWVRVREDYSRPDDLMYAALYIEALEKLTERRYVNHNGGQLYILTGSGFKKARELKAVQYQIHELFEQLENHSYRGAVRDDETLAQIAQTIGLAESLLALIKQNPRAPGISSSKSLTQIYLGSALHQRILYYKQQAFALTGYSFYMVRELADAVRSRQPKAKEYLQKMLADLNCLLRDEMKEDVGLKGLTLEWRCMCFRALTDYPSAIQDAKQIVMQNDRDYKSYMLLSDCYWDSHKLPDAIEAATRAIEHCVTDLQRYEALNHRSQIYHEAGNETDAAKDRLHAKSFEAGTEAIIKRLRGEEDALGG